MNFHVGRKYNEPNLTQSSGRMMISYLDVNPFSIMHIGLQAGEYIMFEGVKFKVAQNDMNMIVWFL